MTALSTGIAERARKIESLILQRLAGKTQTAIALELSVSESKISRFKNEDLSEITMTLAALDLKVVDEKTRVISEEKLNSYKRLAFDYLALDLNIDVNQ